jgi:hypothetical protein
LTSPRGSNEDWNPVTGRYEYDNHYWDGARWLPISSTPKKMPGKKWLLAGAALVAVLVFVGIAQWSSDTDSGSTGALSTTTGSAADSGTISGSLDDWLASVCAPGAFYDGTSFPGATGGGACLSRKTQGQQVQVYLLQYDSEFKQNNDLAAYRMIRCARIITDSGRRTVFGVMENNDLPLQPLKQFGIEIYDCV